MKRFTLISVFVTSVSCLALPGARAQTPPTPGDSVIYTACMQVDVDEIRKKGVEEQQAQRAASFLCQVGSSICQKELRGEACMKEIRRLNDGLEKSGQSLTYMAAYAGRMDLIQVLIEIGADINKPIVGTGWTPLMIAAAEGHSETVSALIRAGANVNATNALGRTALMFASSKGFAGIVKDLLIHRADPNIVPVDDTGWTALIAAARTGRIDVIKALLDHGADVTINDKEGKTALVWAEAQGHADVVRVLTEATTKK